MIGVVTALLLAQAAPIAPVAAPTMCGRQSADTLRLIDEVLGDKSVSPVQRSDTWIAVRDPSGALWTITLKKNPAYPAVICRRVVGDQRAGFSIDSQMICDAPRPACEKARADIVALNEQAKTSLAGK